MRLHKILFLILVCLCTLKTYVQGQSHYEVLHSASGIIVSSNDQNQIDQAVQSLIDRLPVGIQSQFKVYSADFYIHQQVYPGSYPDVFLSLVNEVSSPYYILIAKGIVLNSDVSEWYVELNLPDDNEFACWGSIDNLQLKYLLGVICNQYSVSANYGVLGITSTLAKLEHYINVIVNCYCDFDDILCQISQFENNDDYLLGMGFRKRQVLLGSSHDWVNGTAGIFDYTTHKSGVIIDGQEYYIPEEVHENKVHLDNGNFAEENDTFYVDFKGRIYIFDNNSFRGGQNENSWYDALSIASSFDYLELWVLLKDDKSGQYYLYSRYTLGELEPIVPVAFDGEDELRAMSPLSLLLKFTVNAVIDIMIEAITNFIFEPKIDSWEDAFKSVNYARVAADALYSLIPWKNSAKKYEFIGRALIGGVGRVLEMSQSNSNYTVKEGFEDFIAGVGIGALGAIVGDKIIQFGSQKLFPGLMKIVASTNSQKVKLVFARCFSTNLMKYGCFTMNTGVYLDSQLQNPISGLKLHDFLLSKQDKAHSEIAHSHVDELFSSKHELSDNMLIRNAIEFRSICGKKSLQLSLDDTDLDKFGIHLAGDLVLLLIAEQGVEGIYIVTDIKRLKPPKVPYEENTDGANIYSYITSIYQHTSDDVWKLAFESGDEVEATGSHPFYDAVADEWKPVVWLQPGDILRTKDGRDVLLAKEKLEGEHQVYNITVAGTHTYFVGDGGLWVHNSCGNLDNLVKKFNDHVSSTIKLAEISEWWAKGWPTNGEFLESIFGRGRFFEKLMRQSKFSSWKWTGDISSNFPGIDFYKVIGGKNVVASLKTSNMTPSAWLNTQRNKDHMKALVKGIEDKQFSQGPQKVVKANEVRLVIAVPQGRLSDYANFESSVHALKSQIPGIDKIKVEVVTIENALGL